MAYSREGLKSENGREENERKRTCHPHGLSSVLGSSSLVRQDTLAVAPPLLVAKERLLQYFDGRFDLIGGLDSEAGQRRGSRSP